MLQKYRTTADDVVRLLMTDVLKVSKETLFNKSEFVNLTEEERLDKAIELGWRCEISSGKYYRIIQ